MRIGFIENVARQSMTRKGISRNAALVRIGLGFGGLGLGCAAIWLYAPIEKMTITRRGTEVPLEFLLPGMAGLLIGFGLLCLLSLERAAP